MEIRGWVAYRKKERTPRVCGPIVRPSPAPETP